jgi:hypothetical protein
MRRSRIVATVATLAAVGAVAFVVVFLVGRFGMGPAGSATPPATGPSSQTPATTEPLPSICPLSGREADGGVVPNRPALAVKVENLSAARPQTGLSWADIVYEQPVEALITRFIAVYQCQDASRIQPVRSARLTDPDILVQFGRPLFGYAGGVPSVRAAVAEAGLIDVNYLVAEEAYERDPARRPPHDLVTSTQALYTAAGDPTGIPEPLFEYAKQPGPRGKPVSEVHLPFSFDADVSWRWSASDDRFLRWHGTEPHRLSDGTHVSATNVIVQVVKITLTDVRDANGVRSPRVISVGRGKAFVLRGGRVVEGTWVRDSVDDVTRFVDGRGREIKLIAGQTWVELFPSTLTVSLG